MVFETIRFGRSRIPPRTILPTTCSSLPLEEFGEHPARVVGAQPIDHREAVVQPRIGREVVEAAARARFISSAFSS